MAFLPPNTYRHICVLFITTAFRQASIYMFAATLLLCSTSVPYVAHVRLLLYHRFRTLCQRTELGRGIDTPTTTSLEQSFFTSTVDRFDFIPSYTFSINMMTILKQFLSTTTSSNLSLERENQWSSLVGLEFPYDLGFFDFRT
jgi:hypothetical protein